jgi:hypothetical protein
MGEIKYFKKFQKKLNNSKRVQYFEKGYHVLSMEEP